jgi:hypothetical protein
MSHGQGKGQVAHWSFASSEDATPRDSVRGVAGTVNGYYKYVAGVSGDALRFDGYTTGVSLLHWPKTSGRPVLHTTDTARPHEWQETIVLNQPGSTPDDDINWDAHHVGKYARHSQDIHLASKISRKLCETQWSSWSFWTAGPQYSDSESEIAVEAISDCVVRRCFG